MAHPVSLISSLSLFKIIGSSTPLHRASRSLRVFSLPLTPLSSHEDLLCGGLPLTHLVFNVFAMFWSTSLYLYLHELGR
ncbi:hypothetical protein B0H65DRAFT_480508 [Neurospora tetraspora]|uniref:Uncharacterized protein n=1 Tax=Neurospora tetraspora TaxID=94610 RepID=A0AAE0MJZ6_9PEZI|nr:hypothetical protein B0H65DRAFT_480508 [Neurospora tetraspora]